MTKQAPQERLSEKDGNDPLLTKLFRAGDNYIGRVSALREVAQLTAANFSSDTEQHQPLPGFFYDELKHLSKVQQEQAWNKLQEVANELATSATKAKSQSREVTTISLGKDRIVGELVSKTFLGLAHRITRPDKTSVVARSLLVIAVSDFELVIADVSSAVMRAVPEALNKAEATLNLAQLIEFGSVEAATSYLIDRRAEDLLRGDLSDWDSWFGRFGVRFTDMAKDWPSVVEIFARRNLVVHNDLRVNRQYSARLKDCGWTQEIPALDTRLEVDAEYLSHVVNVLLALGVLLVGGVALQLRKDATRECHRWLKQRVERLLEEGFYEAASFVSDVVISKARGRMQRETELRMITFRWIANREVLGVESISREVAAWDVSGLDEYYKHVRTVLLGDIPQTLASTKRMLAAGRLSRLGFRMNPLYKPFILLTEFQELLSPPDPNLGTGETSSSAE